MERGLLRQGVLVERAADQEGVAAAALGHGAQARVIRGDAVGPRHLGHLGGGQRLQLDGVGVAEEPRVVDGVQEQHRLGGQGQQQAQPAPRRLALRLLDEAAQQGEEVGLVALPVQTIGALDAQGQPLAARQQVLVHQPLQVGLVGAGPREGQLEQLRARREHGGQEPLGAPAQQRAQIRRGGRQAA